MSETIMTWDNIKAVLLFSCLLWAPRILIAVLDAVGKIADAWRDTVVNRDRCQTAKDIVKAYGNRAGPVSIPSVIELDVMEQSSVEEAVPAEIPCDPPAEPVHVLPSRRETRAKSRSRRRETRP